MREIRVYHVDAFTSEKFGGNTAGVVLDAEKLTEAEMQSIAKELNLPESVFLFPSTNSAVDYKVRYFTPTEEINFCGHATVGLTWVLANEFGLAEQKDGIVLETNVGNIPIIWHKENGKVTKVEMTQVAPSTKDFEIDLQVLSELIGVNKESIDSTYPIKLASTGNWHLLVPIKTVSAINEASPDFKALGKQNKEHQLATTHLYTFNTENDYDLYTRDFAPGIGIDEDPVTGAANGALAGFLYLEGILSKKDTTNLKIAQGDAIGRPGTLYVTVVPVGDKAVIKVAGEATITIRGILSI
ncbi:PhzF family phenazine biosynthesis protein [Bacillus sp. EAC]|uniref:PhzF family phenazine biosynthesis protein n=1 Tax=Bacillus sp. EAC TaxID=1978338 RepID=UPI000B44C885|nr:PhzF family phenazine biosynthesis protein [Bacillus sp. EAC]